MDGGRWVEEKGKWQATTGRRDGYGLGLPFSRSGSGPISVGASLAGEAWVESAVRDDGPGISKKVLESLFIPFFTTKEKGTGLGLAIVKSIVQAAGGMSDVVSHPGAGSTFRVLLPGSAAGTKTPLPPKLAL